MINAPCGRSATRPCMQYAAAGSLDRRVARYMEPALPVLTLVRHPEAVMSGEW